MNIGRDQIIELLRSQGHNDQADQAGSELPGQIDTSNPSHAGKLSTYGIEPSELEGKLGGLGNVL